MKVSDLFSADMEPVLNQWIRQFIAPADLFAAIPELYEKLNSQKIEGIVEDAAVIAGPVYIGVGSIVRAQAIIRGPAIVGNNTVVNSHAEIQPGCFIGSNCSIGHGCSIVQSMLMDRANVSATAFVRDSVLGFGSIVGPRAVLGAKKAELLGDETSGMLREFGVMLGDYAIVGANSTLKAGTMVGSRTIVGEAIVAEGIYEKDQIIRFSQNVEIGLRRDQR
jgi:UDP-N-acetylglucosamine diphosphorylase / glucose-1-phosphate thymidylyltransferase / UDP-N-acetylgalactosamine diphosphorylase / glucosamine-1-phosphate N-acetyltransferase / galactosamine-1-phosphate N-acetyltransferase